ncbi:MAG: MarR family transcriptional regulator [Anaerolineae bacterium]|nr:MarR family transcriptional regulator [Anaerolineae bacterium]
MPQSTQLRFYGSVWCNLDIALRNLDQLFGRATKPLGLTIIEWYILRSLYERDGQHASELARAVGRAATSFTPNLDKLEGKGLIERRPDPTDRRAVHIYLTSKAEVLREPVTESAAEVDNALRQRFSPEEYGVFLSVLSTLQALDPDHLPERSSNGHHHEPVPGSSFSKS